TFARQARQFWLAQGAHQLLEAATENRQHKRRSSRRKRQPVSETAADGAYPIWVDVSGWRMFVVGYTPGGVSIHGGRTGTTVRSWRDSYCELSGRVTRA